MVKALGILTFSVFISPFFCQGQTKPIEELKRTLWSENDPGKKLDDVIALCEQRQSLHTDTLVYYADLAKKMAVARGDKEKIILADYFISNYLAKKGQFDSSINITDKNLARLDYKNNRDTYLKFSIQKGQIFIKTEKYKEAFEQFYKILGEAERAGDGVTQVNVETNIGWINMEMGQNEQALKWFYDALQVIPGQAIPDYSGVIYSNMAATYNELNQNDSAGLYIRKAISVNRKSGKNLTFLANALAIQADIFLDTKQKSQAESSLNEALKIRQQIGEPFYIVSDMTQLAIFYASNNETDQGIALCKKGINMAKQFGLASKLQIIYEALAKNYKAAGMFKDYAATLNTIMGLKDSIYQKNSAESLADIQGKYDLQKKENTIIQQKLDLTKKNYLFYGLVGLIMLTLFSTYFIFRSYRKKQTMEMQLMVEEEKRLAMRAVIQAGENERKRISADLHDNLGVYAASIASNIDHILLHETASENIIPLKELQNNSQSIVSQLSDTIWALKKDALSLTAISDRLKLFIQRMQVSYPYTKIDVMEEIAFDHLLTPSQAFHLFQVMKETINNALKHGECKQIYVIIESDAQWKIYIADDGPDDPEVGNGNGMLSMKNRAHEAGWKIVWQPNKPKGTCVIIEPVANTPLN